MKIRILISLVLLLSGLSTAGTLIHVPGNYAGIQLAINAASDGDTVLVDPGIYYENISFLGKKIIVASRFLTTGNTMYIDSTVIDGSRPSKPDTASVVLFVHGEDTSSVIEGFTLTGGTGTVWKDLHNFGLYREGGAVLSELSSPTIRNNYIRGNVAVNTAGVSSAGGGGIRSSDGEPHILNNYITGNRGRYGGGIVLNYTGAVIRNNVIYNNTGGEDYGGSGIWAYSNGPSGKIIENNTIVSNSSALDGGGLSISSTSVSVHNNIIWGNTAATQPQISVSSAAVSVTYSDVQGGWAGTGNINSAPVFRDTSHYLESTSPGVDAGDPTVQFDDPEDPLHPGSALWPSKGTTRCDMGAYGGPAAAATIYVDLHLDDPLPPKNFTAYSDYRTPSSATLRWTDPTAANNGSPIHNFRIHLYRDSVFIAEADSGVQTWTDTGLVLHQQYLYRSVTVVPGDSGTAAVDSCIAGGSAYPAPPSSFTASDGSSGAVLRWINPSRQADGTPLNDFGAIYIYRDGALADSVLQTSADSGLARSYVDSLPGYHEYMICSRDTESPVHTSVLSDSILAFSRLTTTYFEDFEGGVPRSYRPGTWDSTSLIAFTGRHSLASNQNAHTPNNVSNIILMPSVILTTDMTLRFHDIAIINPASEYAFVEISTNHRKSFKTLATLTWNSYAPWSDGHADSADWRAETFSLSAYKNDTVTIRFRCVSLSGATGQGWYIDSMAIYPTYPPAAFTYHPDSAWNLLSLPVVTTSHTTSVLFPGAVSQAFSFNGNYETIDSLTPGDGFWLQFQTADSIPVNGTAILRDSIQLRQGWNLIGGITAPVDSSSLLQYPSGLLSGSFYGYQNGYQPASILVPGAGYWIKARQAGSIVVTGPAAGAPSGMPVRKSAGDPFNHLIFTDNTGRQLRLGFGISTGHARTGTSFELPPLPPNGAPDVRFEDNTGIRLFSPRRDTGCAIRLQGVRPPVRLSWTLASPAGSGWEIRIDSAVRSIGRAGNCILASGAEKIELTYRGEGSEKKPTGYELGQNYPNPFNPSTTIRYALPSAGRVVLRVYNVLGQEVARLVDRMEDAGVKTVIFDGSSLPGGVYFYRITAGSYTAARKLTLMK